MNAKIPITFHHGSVVPNSFNPRRVFPNPTPKNAPAVPLISSNKCFLLNVYFPKVKIACSIFFSSFLTSSSLRSIFLSSAITFLSIFSTPLNSFSILLTLRRISYKESSFLLVTLFFGIEEVNF